jgi:hypothetical protein
MSSDVCGNKRSASYLQSIYSTGSMLVLTGKPDKLSWLCSVENILLYGRVCIRAVLNDARLAMHSTGLGMSGSRTEII